MRERLLGVLAMLAVAGCTTTQPSEYAAALSTKDPKWRSSECKQIRADAANYKPGETISVPASLLLGPYGLGMAMAGKEHQAKKRKQLARDMHVKCSSQPLPQSLK